MIRFVIYDDQKEFCKKYVETINKVMMKNKNEYVIEEFNSYSKKFETLIQDSSTKIYILDIEIPKSKSGIDVAKLIRVKDWNSLIIMITSHTELGYEALKAQIMLLDFICKFNSSDNHLFASLNKAINMVDEKKIITFETNNIYHRIFLDDILYVYKDTVDRKCIIKTTFSEFIINMTLSELLENLDSRFYLSHRGCAVNTSRIDSVNWKIPKIVFDNKESCDMVSRDKKKGLKQYVVED